MESADVNAYLREAIGEDFSAKDFRTWAGTTFVAAQLLAIDPPSSVKQAKGHVQDAIDAAAKNSATPAPYAARHTSTPRFSMPSWKAASSAVPPPRAAHPGA